jgi:hypothetical protein
MKAPAAQSHVTARLVIASSGKGYPAADIGDRPNVDSNKSLYNFALSRLSFAHHVFSFTILS